MSSTRDVRFASATKSTWSSTRDALTAERVTICGSATSSTSTSSGRTVGSVISDWSACMRSAPGPAIARLRPSAYVTTSASGLRSRTTSRIPAFAVGPVARSTSSTLEPLSASASASARVHATEDVRSSPTGASPRCSVLPGTCTARTASARSMASRGDASAGSSATSSPPLERTWRGPRTRTSSASSASASASPTARAVIPMSSPTRAVGGTTLGRAIARIRVRALRTAATTTAKRPLRPSTSSSSTDHSGGRARSGATGAPEGASLGGSEVVLGVLIVIGAYRCGHPQPRNARRPPP